MNDRTSSLPAARSAAGGPFVAWIDAIAHFCAKLGDVLVVAIACMLFYEVVARYVFKAPTIWTQDVAIAAQVWFTYLGMAYVLRQKQLIRITAFLAIAGPGLRRVAEAFSLLVIAAFCVVAVVYGWEVVADSIRLGRRQPTMLEMPNWVSEVPVIIGFALLGIQALAELIRLPFRPAPTFTPGGEHSIEENAT